MNKSTCKTIFLLITGSFLAAWLLFYLIPGLFQSWDLLSRDQLFKFRYKIFGKRETSPYIIHVDMDDASLRDLPYSSEDQNLYGDIVTILNDAYADSIIFDMVFIRCEDLEKCNVLLNATESFGKVYFPVILRPLEEIHPEGGKENLVKKEIPADTYWQPNILVPGEPIDAGIAFTNYGQLEEVARGLGHITCYPDQDGIYRKFPLLIKTEKGYIPSMSFRQVCEHLKMTPDRIDVAFGSDITLRGAKFPDGRKKDIRIPIDRQGKTIINYTGPWQDSYSHYSFARLMKLAQDEELFDQLIDEIEGAMVVLSDVSTGGRDFGSIPLENFYPLSGLHANVINSILKEDFIDVLSVREEILTDVLLAAFIFGAALFHRGIGFATGTIVFYLAFLAFSSWLFFYQNIFSNIIRSSIGIVLSFGTVNIYKYLREEKEKAFIRASFESYFAPELLNKILKSKEALESREKKQLTIMFSDIVGFTSWSSTRHAEEIHRTLNEYFDEMAKIVFKYQGTIDKYIGDGLLVFFGDPIEYEDHPLRAVQASIDMQKSVRELKKRWKKEGGMPIKIRIGLNTGEVVVGNMGSAKRLDYTVIGANVNLAQRLESNAPHEGILISRSVYDSVHESVPTKPVGKIKVKGYTEEIEVFEVLIEDA